MEGDFADQDRPLKAPPPKRGDFGDFGDRDRTLIAL